MPIWIGIVSLLCKNSNSCFEPVSGPYQTRKPYLLFASVVFLPIFLLAAFGRPISDTWAYIEGYKRFSYHLANFGDFWDSLENEHGFALFNAVIYYLTDGSIPIFRATIALVHLLPVIAIYRRYSCNYLLSAFLFVISGTYVGWMMNGLRQFMAVTIIFAATPLLVKKRFFALILVILLASTIHKTALIMLPIIFIVHGKAFNQRTMLYIAGSLLLTWLFAGNMSYYDDFADMAGYGESAEELRLLGDDGVNIFRVIISAVPCLLAWMGRKIIEEKNDIFLNICVNMSMITLGINLVASVTSGILVGRLPIYTGLYNQLLLPWLVTRMYDEKTSLFLTIMMLFGYICLYPFEIGFRIFM